jgi:hypothetical protein
VRSAAVALVAAGAGVLALSVAVPWSGRTPLLTDTELRPTGTLVVMVAVQWIVLVAHAARRGARACFVGTVGVLAIGLAASATRTAEDMSVDPFSPPGVALAAFAATLSLLGFLVLAATAGSHRLRGWRSPTPWLRSSAVWFWTIGILIGLAGSPWFGIIENGDWRADVVWFREGAPWVPLVACAALQLLILAKPFSHTRFSAPLLGAGTAATIAVATGLETIPRLRDFDPLEQSPMVLALGVTTVCATVTALVFLSMLTFDAGRPSPPPPPPG